MFDIKGLCNDNEKELLKNSINYLIEMDGGDLNIDNLKELEICDKLEFGSVGRTKKNRILLSYEIFEELFKDLNYNSNTISFNLIEYLIDKNDYVKEFLGTLYHELCHIDVWNKYPNLCDWVEFNCEDDCYRTFAIMYLIEYLVHRKTCELESFNTINKFCLDFVKRDWEKDSNWYWGFLKYLPYFISRSIHINTYHEQISHINDVETRYLVENIYTVTQRIEKNDIEDDFNILHPIEILFKEFIEIKN